MMAIFGTHTQIKEMLEFVDFALAPILFQHESLHQVICDIVVAVMESKTKQWILLRKITNNLTIALTEFPNAITAMKKILLKLVKSNETRGYDASVILSE